jgi:hypothetical protein
MARDAKSAPALSANRDSGSTGWFYLDDLRAHVGEEERG